MRRFTLLFAALLGATAMKAQTVATFDTLTLHGTDTEYVNYSAPGTDVGFNNGLAHFPCVYDTAGGDYWAAGFVYSNWTDSVVVPGFGGDSVYYLDASKECIARTGIGYGGSAQYAVAYCNDPVNYVPAPVIVHLLGAAIGEPVEGFYVTNTCYAYSSMKYGDALSAAFSTHSDWFLLTVKGYMHGALTTDSVSFYLGDSTSIVSTWQWVNLMPLGDVDSLQLSLSSSHVASGSMTVPAYFAMDNFTTHESSTSVKNLSSYVAKVYPNPATNVLYVDAQDGTVQQVKVLDMAGRVVAAYAMNGSQLQINTATYAAGSYILELEGEGQKATVKFVKQ